MNNVEKLHVAQRHAMSIRPATHGFPYLAEALRLAGVRMSYFDVASGGALYLMGGGNVYQPGAARHVEPVTVPDFDKEGLVSAIDADKAGEINFPEFLRRSWAAGVVRYEVDTTQRTCTYLSVDGERYIEHYPAVTIALPDAFA